MIKPGFTMVNPQTRMRTVVTETDAAQKLLSATLGRLAEAAGYRAAYAKYDT